MQTGNTSVDHPLLLEQNCILSNTSQNKTKHCWIQNFTTQMHTVQTYIFKYSSRLLFPGLLQYKKIGTGSSSCHSATCWAWSPPAAHYFLAGHTDGTCAVCCTFTAFWSALSFTQHFKLTINIQVTSASVLQLRCSSGVKILCLTSPSSILQVIHKWTGDGTISASE